VSVWPEGKIERLPFPDDKAEFKAIAADEIALVFGAGE
jgi:hypothetical protein